MIKDLLDMPAATDAQVPAGVIVVTAIAIAIPLVIIIVF